jgi:hypothetical protein
MSLQDAMAAARRQHYGDIDFILARRPHLGNKISAGKAAAHRATLVAKATASTGTSPLLNMW